MDSGSKFDFLGSSVLSQTNGKFPSNKLGNPEFEKSEKIKNATQGNRGPQTQNSKPHLQSQAPRGLESNPGYEYSIPAENFRDPVSEKNAKITHDNFI